MRKADYAALAEIIRTRLSTARQCNESGPSTFERNVAAGRMQGLTEVAETFAYPASVNRAEFLKACGINP